MRGHSPTYKRPLAKSANLQSKKDHKSSSKLMACSVHQFQFTLPAYSIPITLRNIFSAPVPTYINEPQQSHTVPLEDGRRELIKQKIKFRVKQEMWNFIKKNYQKPALIDSSYQESSKLFFDPEKQEPFVKGSAFLRVSKDDISFRKKSNTSQRIFSVNSLKQNEKESEEKKTKGHRRVWSSFVKMKDKDRMEMQRNCQRVSASTVNIEKLDAYKIQPWKGFDDPENIYEEH